MSFDKFYDALCEETSKSPNDAIGLSVKYYCHLAFQAGAASRDAEIAELDAANKDAKRYRFIRDNPWNGTDLESVITCHLNAVWDLAIDEAIRARGDTK